MSLELIARNPDLKRLQDEGYEIEIVGGNLIMHHIPYVDECRQIRLGMLAAPLNCSGALVLAPHDHVISFQGHFPCYSDGGRIEALFHQSVQHRIGDYTFDHKFSNKPPNGYADYHAKFTRYADIITSQAMAINPNATAKTFKPVICDESPVFHYEDTNSSRAGITPITEKTKNQKVAIVGLGGTGGYILDFIAKTPVAEIHLFDGDQFCQHNAFRAPGAASIDELNQIPMKTDIFAKTYSKMHKQIYSHPEYVTESNLYTLDEMTVVFICVDSGQTRQLLSDYLDGEGVFYVDSGISVMICDETLLGSVRITGSTEQKMHRAFLPVNSDENDVYASNIQISELNALAAILSVLLWKKRLGIYQDVGEHFLSVFDTNDEVIKHEPHEED